MRLNLPAVLLVFTGAVLVYSGVKHRDPRNVVLEALGSKRRVPEPLYGVGSAVAGAAGDAAKKGADSFGKGVPDPGVRPPTTTGHGPIVSV